MAPKKAARKGQKPVAKKRKKATSKRGLSAKKKDEARQRLIARAVIDPAFRKKLFRNPKAVLGKGYRASDLKALAKIEAALPLLDVQLSHLAGSILCVDTGGGGGTGIA